MDDDRISERGFPGSAEGIDRVGCEDLKGANAGLGEGQGRHHVGYDHDYQVGLRAEVQPESSTYAVVEESFDDPGCEREAERVEQEVRPPEHGEPPGEGSCLFVRALLYR